MANIRGTSGRDVMRGTSRTDTVWGLDGADEFYWRPGMGNDTIHGGDLGEMYDLNPYNPGNPGGDRLFVTGDIDVVLTMGVTNGGRVEGGGQKMVFSGIERITLGGGDDIVRLGNAGPNKSLDDKGVHGVTLATGAGNDLIMATRFGDIIDGGSGNDTIYAGAGDDFIQSSTGNDWISGGLGNENIRWGNGDDRHAPGNDTIFGGAGNDLINIWVKKGYVANGGGVEVDINLVNNGSMGLTAETDIGGRDSTLKAQGFELVWTHEGKDVVTAANARIMGQGNQGVNVNTRWGDDNLTGSRGNDTLDVSFGRDTVEGGAGNDDIWIGDGRIGDGDRDVLIFRGEFGRDVVHAFDVGIDVIDLGGRAYVETVTDRGTLLTVGQNSILLDGVFDF